MTLKIIDWALMESDYIHGYYVTNNRGVQKHVYPTVEMLAKKYEANTSAINRRCSQDKWVVRREQYREKIREKTFDKCEQTKIDVLLSESAKYDTQNLQKLDQVDKILNTYLAKYSKMSEMDEDTPPVDLRELETFMNILLKRHQLSRGIFGEATSAKPKESNKTNTIAKSTDKPQNLEVLVESMKKNESLKAKLLAEKNRLLEAVNRE